MTAPIGSTPPGYGPMPFRPVRGVRNLLGPLGVPMSGLTAQRTRVETIAQNIANIDTTRTASGDPYRRQYAVLRQAADGRVEVESIQQDQSEFTWSYEPGHEDADEAGYVKRPNVQIPNEMADLLIARRMFEANATVIDAAKAMLQRALDI